ncbi:MAG: GntR family transcriptional regulator [Actinomycetales bacterium]
MTAVAGTDSGLGPTSDQVRLRLLDLVQRGALRPGQRLGAERTLADELGVSRASLRQALGWLEEAGVVRRVPGRSGGIFVTGSKVERDLSRIVGVPMLLRDQGFAAGTRVVSVGVRPAGNQAAEALHISPGSFIVDLVRIRFADQAPISLEQAMLPADRVPDLPAKDLSGSLYELLDREYGIRPGEAIERIEVTAAGPQEAAILEIAAGQPVLAITRTTTDPQGAVFEYSRDLFRADRTRMLVRTAGSPPTERAQLTDRRVEVLVNS